MIIQLCCFSTLLIASHSWRVMISSPQGKKKKKTQPSVSATSSLPSWVRHNFVLSQNESSTCAHCLSLLPNLSLASLTSPSPLISSLLFTNMLRGYQPLKKKRKRKKVKQQMRVRVSFLLLQSLKSPPSFFSMFSKLLEKESAFLASSA